MGEILAVGKWYEFDAGTCFGSTKRHFGVVVGIDREQQIVIVAVNATSQVEKLIWFADLHGIPIEDAMVDVTDDIHFDRPTGLDCHRPQKQPMELVLKWINEGKIRKSSYNEDLAVNKLKMAVDIMLRSPLIAESTKRVIRSSNQGLV